LILFSRTQEEIGGLCDEVCCCRRNPGRDLLYHLEENEFGGVETMDEIVQLHFPDSFHTLHSWESADQNSA
jgi:hypothetical protein